MFIELTTKKSLTKVLINVNHVEAVFSDGCDTRIQMQPLSLDVENYYVVAESYQDVHLMLRDIGVMQV